MTGSEARAAANRVRYSVGQTSGHYESFFQRANHPQRPLGFWIRYTVLFQGGRPESAMGEVWAVFFDGERGRVTAVKERHPLAGCELRGDKLGIRIGAASLEDGSLRGAAQRDGRRIGWALDYQAPEPPLLLLPERLYEGRFPKAKSLVVAPRAHFSGALEIDGRTIDVSDWVGSHNHNWGERHTERYVWGQVAGFDDEPDAFLECASARVRVGPVLSPWMTVAVLRLEGQEYHFRELLTAALAREHVDGLSWHFETSYRGVRIEAELQAPPSAFVGLRYDDTDGSQKICLNSKLASCELRIARDGQPTRVLRTRHRAAFELLNMPRRGDIPIAL